MRKEGEIWMLHDYFIKTLTWMCLLDRHMSMYKNIMYYDKRWNLLLSDPFKKSDMLPFFYVCVLKHKLIYSL